MFSSLSTPKFLLRGYKATLHKIISLNQKTEHLNILLLPSTFNLVTESRAGIACFHNSLMQTL